MSRNYNNKYNILNILNLKKKETKTIYIKKEFKTQY